MKQLQIFEENMNTANHQEPQLSTIIAKGYQFVTQFQQNQHLLNSQEGLNDINIEYAKLPQHVSQNSTDINAEERALLPGGQLAQPSNFRIQGQLGDSQYGKIAKPSKSPAKGPSDSEAFIAGTGGSTNKCRHCNGAGLDLGSQRTNERVDSNPHRGAGIEHLKINLDPYANITGESAKAQNAKEEASEQSESLKKAYAQMAEDAKKISQLEEENQKLKEQLAQNDKAQAKSQKQLTISQSQVHQQEKQINELKETIAGLQQTREQAQLNKRMLSQMVQTPESLITEKELDLMVELKQYDRKFRKVEKEKSYNANKISKFIYFFFTLQNKGIPVNEIYEKDGVKFIKTERFQEIMGQNGAEQDGTQEQPDSKADEISFWSDDSYEYVPVDEAIVEKSRFKNVHNLHIPELNFEGLPEYETTDEEEEEEEDPSMSQKQEEMQNLGLNSPQPRVQTVPFNQGTPIHMNDQYSQSQKKKHLQ